MTRGATKLIAHAKAPSSSLTRKRQAHRSHESAKLIAHAKAPSSSLTRKRQAHRSRGSAKLHAFYGRTKHIVFPNSVKNPCRSSPDRATLSGCPRTTQESARRDQQTFTRSEASPEGVSTSDAPVPARGAENTRPLPPVARLLRSPAVCSRAAPIAGQPRDSLQSQNSTVWDMKQNHVSAFRPGPGEYPHVCIRKVQLITRPAHQHPITNTASVARINARLRLTHHPESDHPPCL